jgi:hypothetical protein
VITCKIRIFSANYFGNLRDVKILDGLYVLIYEPSRMLYIKFLQAFVIFFLSMINSLISSTALPPTHPLSLSRTHNIASDAKRLHLKVQIPFDEDHYDRTPKLMSFLATQKAEGLEGFFTLM